MGQSISLTHLAPFVNVSRKKFQSELRETEKTVGVHYTEEQFNAIVEARVKDEITKGVQTIQYQIVTLMTTNGQAPFVTVFMYLNETDDEQTKSDLALVIEEVLKQRHQGVKNEAGYWITPAFPKLIYVLEEDNINEDSKYFYLTELAAKCTARRLVPDYISEKIMKQLKEGNCYPAMGCVQGDEVIAYKFMNNVYVESFKRMWERIARYYTPNVQKGRANDLYIDLSDTYIYDNVSGWTECKRLIRNGSSELTRLSFTNGRILDCTADHPFETENRGVVRADKLTQYDIIKIDKEFKFINSDGGLGNKNIAWVYGLLLCDSTYDKHITLSLASTGEDDIKERFIATAFSHWGVTCNVKTQQRERKGTYQDITIKSTDENVIKISNELIGLFGGIKKADRHIPSEVFSWNKESRISFLAGMMDADGYIGDNSRMSIVFLGSVNKELAIQQALLIQSLGMRVCIYQNHYKGKGRADTVRYSLNFYPTKELVDAMACEKKKAKFVDAERSNHSIAETNVASLKSRYELPNKEPSYDVTTASEHFTVSGIYSHNCRSFLTVYHDENDKPKFYGRFNQGVVTINLVDVACSSGGDEEKFWKIFDERLEMCRRALMIRHKRLLNTPSDVAPILWQNGAIARLKKGEKINNLLLNGYSTISLGYAGLCECVRYMKGVPHTDPSATPFALDIMKYMNKKTAEWRKETSIAFSLYGTPIESTTYKFAKCLKKRFGIIEGVTDKNYITNSYHVHVTEPIDAFSKLTFESQFQALSPGGAISYVEVPNMENNIPAVITVLKHIYENIMYAELNTKSDCCQKCGYTGEIRIVTDSENKLIWQCPQCGNTDQSTMNVARRTCGK